MHQYLVDTEYCSKELFKLIFEEKNRLKSLESEKIVLDTKFQYFYKRYEESELNEDASDIQLQHTYMEAAEVGTSLNNLKSKIDYLEYSISIKEFSLKTLAGSILQIAKQGISIVHNNLPNCPAGRALGQETLKNVIWQGRNQAIHFENIKNTDITKCFNHLEQDFGIKFHLSSSSPDNKALHVLEILDWETYEKYIAEMESILQ